MSDDLVLYSHPKSRGRVARWMLEETGQPYEVRYLDYATTMHGADYLAINPLGKVPALVHGARVVTEYAAICAYLADAFPQSGLVPADRSAYYRWLFFGAGPFEAAVINKVCGFAVPENMRAVVGFRPLPVMLDALESALADQPYLAGSEFSAADVATGSQIGYGLFFGTIEARPVLVAYWNRLKSRPAFVRASAADDAALQEGQ